MLRSNSGVLTAVLLATAAAGCGDSQPPAPPNPELSVKVSHPVARVVTDYEFFTGRTDAVKSVDLRARVTGYLEEVKFKEGSDVKKDEVLFRIDPRTYKALRDQAQASVAAAQSQLELVSAKYQRAQALNQRRAISTEDYQQAAADYAAGDSNLGVAKANLAVAQLNLDFTQVRSPIDGRISRQNIDPGNLVKADDTLLTSIVSLDPMYAYFDVDERTLLRIRGMIRAGKLTFNRETGAPVEMKLSVEADYMHQGTINFADNKVDPATGTLRVRGIFPNPTTDGSDVQLLSPGLYVRVRLPLGQAHPSLLVAESALGADQGQKFLYVLNDENVVEARPVEVGSLQDGLRVIQEFRTVVKKDDQGKDIEVRERVLGPDDRVVLTGLQRLRNGVKVKPELVPMPTHPDTTRPGVVNAPGNLKPDAGKPESGKGDGGKSSPGESTPRR